jgi:photosystem II stability/assembly factor-like uncharacterized protein
LKTNGLQSVYVSSVALDHNQPDTLYASTLSETGSGAGLYRSINAGEIWVPITNGIPTASILQVLASRNIAGRLYAASARQFFRSDDYGANWSSVGVGLQGQEIRIIFQDQLNPGEVLYAGTTNGVYKTMNGGTDWVGTSNVQPNISISGFAETANGIFAATLGTGVWSSTDGLDWQGGLNPLLAHPVAFTILEDYRSSEVLYGIVTRDGVVRSSDGGSTWTIRTNGLISTNVLTLVQDRQSGKIYAGTADNGVFVSEDEAATWKQVPSEFSGLNVPFLELGTSSNLYVGTLGHGLLKSLNSGAALTGGVIPELVDPLMLGVHNTKLQPQVLFAPIDPSGIIKSTNGGLTWRYSKQGIEKVRVRKIAFDPVDPDLMLATAYGGGIYRSTDGGEHWAQSETTPANLVATTISTPGPGGVYFAGTLGNGLIVSTNQGLNWLGATSPDIVKPIVLGISIDPRNPQKLFAATSGNGALISTNAGKTWSAQNDGLTDSILFAFAVDPVDSRNVYLASSSQGVFASGDGGKSWAELNKGLFNKVITSITVDINDHRTIYAGTEGGGVFRMIRNELTPSLQILRGSPGIELSWPTNAVGYKLETRQALRDGSWGEFAEPAAVEGARWKLRLTNILSEGYFRLKQ